jgi:hypothetical protein
MIVRRGSRYVLLTHDGRRVLGTHPSLADAQRQERAVQAHKHARGNPQKTLRDRILDLHLTSLALTRLVFS